jgi:hypothetical protein
LKLHHPKPFKSRFAASTSSAGSGPAPIIPRVAPDTCSGGATPRFPTPHDRNHDGRHNAGCARVGTLIRKLAIKTDREAQTLEDVAALVFMRWYVLPFAAGRSHDELFPIVQKTAKKMSARGRAAALRLPLPAELVPAIVEAG